MSDTPSAPCGVGGFGFVPIAIDHHKIPDELRGDVARLLDRLGIANAYVDALEARVAELEAENKSMRDRFSDADTERNVAQGALKAAFDRVAELEALAREAEESNANAQARLSAAEATIESRRLENEAVRRQLGRAENACDAMEKRVTELEARCKRLETAAHAVYLDCIASDHPWTKPETRNMRALRDVLEAKP